MNPTSNTHSDNDWGFFEEIDWEPPPIINGTSNQEPKKSKPIKPNFQILASAPLTPHPQLDNSFKTARTTPNLEQDYLAPGSAEMIVDLALGLNPFLVGTHEYHIEEARIQTFTAEAFKEDAQNIPANKAMYSHLAQQALEKRETHLMLAERADFEALSKSLKNSYL